MRHTFPNGWTASVIDDGYGSDQGLYEVWAWHADGRRDEDVRGWLTREEADEFVASVEARPTVEDEVAALDARIDHAKAFGKSLAALIGAFEGVPTGAPGVSILDAKGVLIAHTHDGATYHVQWTRCED